MIRSLALSLILFALVGCAPVVVEENILTGVVTYDNVPVWEGRLVLLGGKNHVGLAPIQPDGSFQIINPPLGEVQVAVTNHPINNGTRPDPITGLSGQATCDAPLKVICTLPARFHSPETSGLAIQVAKGTSRVDVRIPREEDDPPPVARPELILGADVGETAPEIAGDDLDGQPMSLAEHRGKVVALVFWAHWCSLCREQFAHYHEVVNRMEGRPFVMLGVNCDPDRGLIKRENGPRGINWRSWWDGVAVGGPITYAYKLDGLPSVILIDPTGVVRSKNLRGAELDAAINDLVRQVPSVNPATSAPTSSSSTNSDSLTSPEGQ